MNMITKGILGVVIVGAVGLGGYLYLTRPVDQSVVPLPYEESSNGALQNVPETDSGNQAENQRDASSEKTLTIDTTQSRATFSLKEDLNGKRITVVGETSAITGTAQLNTTTPASLTIGPVAIDGRTFKTDNERRNNAIARLILESEKPAFTYITFTPTNVEGIPALLENKARFPLIITGNLTIKGVTQPMMFTGTGEYIDDVLRAELSSSIKYGEFGVSVPQLSFLANVEEEVVAELKIIAK